MNYLMEMLNSTFSLEIKYYWLILIFCFVAVLIEMFRLFSVGDHRLFNPRTRIGILEYFVIIKSDGTEQDTFEVLRMVVSKIGEHRIFYETSSCIGVVGSLEEAKDCLPKKVRQFYPSYSGPEDALFYRYN